MFIYLFIYLAHWRCPIQDANDYWKSPEEQAQEESVTGEQGFAPAQDVHNVDT
jgi:hypothetical protein